mmetsp:Transcript_51581/g.122716  ORF Transcript_51581/g.122716 Transcript_51581/m.122716 type:complete len:856 (-) Transcript_51581:136-2703(-)|eukprot:CAMPEP_0178445254 /NCGR_PEP_ID=MMETSP0689_2-20121128/40042_1 /TAXON_ID=160604 /ORGANISM="Amphidinium massartii, Strain CS-259" /LENGTH=855 /DNA_ID=CAMNT_0020069739 /DNA_START=44 /DNA_END=2611 /DNA_ORIENTATION=-
MPRYKQHLGLQTRDEAGPYLEKARQVRKGLLASKSGKSEKSQQLNDDGGEYPRADVQKAVQENGGSLTQAVAALLQGLPVGGTLAFAGLDNEQRSIVHRCAHHLGMEKMSKPDPNAGEGSRIVCVKRTKATIHTAVAESENDAAKPGVEKNDGTGKPCLASKEVSGGAVSGQRRRWRRTLASESAQPEDDAGNSQGSPAAVTATTSSTASSPQQLQEKQETKVAAMPKGPHVAWPCGHVCVLWLRDDMRLKDNPALTYASGKDFQAVLPVYIYDTAEANPHPLRGAALHWKAISLQSFAKKLQAMGSRLVLRKGCALEQLVSIIQELAAQASTISVAFNRRTEPWCYQRDKQVQAALEAKGLRVTTFPANVLYEPWDLQPIERWQRWRAKVRAEEATSRGLSADDPARSGQPKAWEHVSGFGSYRFFHHALEELPLPPRPLPDIAALHPCPSGLDSLDVQEPPFGESAGFGFCSALRQCSKKQSSSDWAAEMRQWWPCGEPHALRRLDQFLKEVLATGDFEGRKRLVASRRATSELSPYVRFGELSARTVYWAARDKKERTQQRLFEAEPAAKGGARANATFLRRFVWRDLAYWTLWEFPWMPSSSMRTQYEAQVWNGSAASLQRWKKGETGFPLVDAAMRQLWAVGWMPNYLRHVVAQMLIEYMDVTWKEGLAWFDWTLVDSDVAINSFMWQNGGHSGPDHWEFVLHPVHAAKSCDPDGMYVRRWLPCLAEMPTEYIHRPWDAPVGLRPHFSIYPQRLIKDLDEARREHVRHVIQVRRQHPEMVARTGHEWLKLPGRVGLLAKVVTRDEFRAETEDFIFYQGPQQSSASRRRGDARSDALADAVTRYEQQGPGL